MLRSIVTSLTITFISFTTLASTSSIVGLDVMKTIYQQAIDVGSSKKPPMPKIFVFDNQNQIFLSKGETFELLGVDNEEQKSFVTFVGNTEESPIKVTSSKVITQNLQSNNKRYIAIYFNMPTNSLQPLLEYMPDFLDKQKLVEAALTQNESVVLYKTFL